MRPLASKAQPPEGSATLPRSNIAPDPINSLGEAVVLTHIFSHVTSPTAWQVEGAARCHLNIPEPVAPTARPIRALANGLGMERRRKTGQGSVSAKR